MNFERYIAGRLRASAGRFSKPIVIIGVAGVILSVSIILLSFAIVRGFTTGITDKAVGFNAHIQISDLNAIRGKESGPILANQDFMDELQQLEGIKHIQKFVNRQSIIETDEGVAGVFAKGFSDDFNWSFFKDNMVDGALLEWNDTMPSNEVIISKTLADKLKIKVKDRITFYFIRNEDDFSPRKMTVAGLYNTDMIEFDELFVLMDIRHLQKINDWGLELQVLLDEQCENDQLKVETFRYGGDGIYHIDWSDGQFKDQGTRLICPSDMGDFWVRLSDESETVADTVFVEMDTVDDTNYGCENIKSSVVPGGGSRYDYISGFEIYLDDFDELKEKDKIISNLIGNELTTTTILRQSPEIFSWLELIDLNVYIIIILLLGVAIINMSSALIINILERTQLIGILKSLGATNWSVRKVFLIHAARLITIGLIIGNIIGLGTAWLQQKYGFLKLDPESYSLSEVPILIKWSDVILLDLGTVVVCLLALIIPSYLITRISPVKAIEMD